MSDPGAGAGDPVAAAARAARDAALAVPGVTRLSGGAFGEVATYLPGDRVTGVRVGDDGVHVHVVLAQAALAAIPATAAAVQAAVHAVPHLPHLGLADLPVHVHVEDVESAGRPPREAQDPPGGTREDER